MTAQCALGPVDTPADDSMSVAISGKTVYDKDASSKPMAVWMPMACYGIAKHKMLTLRHLICL